MRIDPKKEAWLKFADSFWDIDRGKSSLEIVESMLTKHVENARNTAYGYTGELDETIASARHAIEEADRENLVDTVHSLCDIGEGDAVARALKNVTLGAIQRNTGMTPKAAAKRSSITAGGNHSPVAFNGQKIKRGATKAFNDAVDAPMKAFNRVVSDGVNSKARSIMEATIARKTTNAAATLKTHPIGKGTEMNKQQYDNEETWSHYAKQEAAGRLKSDTEAAKTVEPPTIRMDAFNDTKARLPFEFRGVNQSETVPVGFNLGATVDVVNPNGSAHGPITFIGDTTPNVVGQTKNYGFPMKDAKFPNKQPQGKSQEGLKGVKIDGNNQYGNQSYEGPI
jgi:hypothetical protein